MVHKATLLGMLGFGAVSLSGCAVAAGVGIYMASGAVLGGGWMAYKTASVGIRQATGLSRQCEAATTEYLTFIKEMEKKGETKRQIGSFSLESGGVTEEFLACISNRVYLQTKRAYLIKYEEPRKDHLNAFLVRYSS